MLSATLFRLARSRYGRFLIGWAFAYGVPLLPLRWLHKDGQTVAFAHPRPFWPRHYLVVPRRAVPHLLALDLTKTADAALLPAIFHAAQQVAQAQQLDAYTILVNGGAAQDVAQLHFHLAQGRDRNGRLWGKKATQQQPIAPKQPAIRPPAPIPTPGQSGADIICLPRSHPTPLGHPHPRPCVIW